MEPHNLTFTNYKALSKLLSEFAANNMGTLTSVLEQGTNNFSNNKFNIGYLISESYMKGDIIMQKVKQKLVTISKVA